MTNKMMTNALLTDSPLMVKNTYGTFVLTVGLVVNSIDHANVPLTILAIRSISDPNYALVSDNTGKRFSILRNTICHAYS